MQSMLLLCTFAATAPLSYFSSMAIEKQILILSLLYPRNIEAADENVLHGNLIHQSLLLPNGVEEIKWDSCTDQTLIEWEEHFEGVHEEQSLYQKISFDESLENEDKCLTLDTTMQQCSSYRPHYHEPFVHYSASYLNDGIMSGVKRVAFVGGGDSMLLHEVLKYQGLEIVLGLELDQKVTR